MHNFAGLIPPQKYLVIDAAQATSVSMLAQLLSQLYCIYEVQISMQQLILAFLRPSVPANSNFYFPAAPGLRLTHSLKPTRTGTILYATPKSN